MTEIVLFQFSASEWIAIITIMGVVLVNIINALRMDRKIDRVAEVMAEGNQKVGAIDTKVGTMKAEIDGRLTEYRRLVEAKAVVDVAAALVQGRTQGIHEERIRKTDAAEGVLETARGVAKEVLAAATAATVDSVADVAADGIIQMDATGIMTYANAVVCLLSGYAAQELIGHSIEKLMPTYLVARHRKSFADYVATGKRHLDWSRVQVAMITARGTEVPITISFGDRVIDGQRTFVGVMRKR
jgi:PAS domain S-box-containing protein